MLKARAARPDALLKAEALGRSVLTSGARQGEACATTEGRSPPALQREIKRRALADGAGCAHPSPVALYDAGDGGEAYACALELF